MISDIATSEARPCTKRTKKPVRPIGQRLFYTKNFHRLDRSLDHFIDSTDRLNRGEKQVLRKLLLLRKREDATEVKVTISGLSTLLHINIKTARRNLKGLVEKGFVLLLGNKWDDGCNYAKKVYAFPLTFPGFDLARVFIKRGARKQYQVRMERKAIKAAQPEHQKDTRNQDQQGTSSNVQETALQAEKMNNSTQEVTQDEAVTCPKAATFTCPTMPSLLDCSSNLRTSDFSDEKIREHSPRSAPPSPDCEEIPLSEKANTKLIEDFYCPELKEQIKKLLWRSKDRKRIKYLARFFNHVMDQYPKQFKTLEDRLFFAREFSQQDINNCKYEVDGKRKVIKGLMWLIRFSAENCITPSYEKSMEYQLRWNMPRDHKFLLYRQMEDYLAESRN